MESDNQDAPYNRIHLTHYVPYGSSERAKAICGAKLREGFLYTTLTDGVRNRDPRTWVYKRHRQQHTLELVFDFHYRVCPLCMEHEDYALALLAETP